MKKEGIQRLVEKGDHGKRINRYFDMFIMSLILLSVVAIILESVPSINNKYGVFLERFNLVTVIVFTIEYILRIYVSPLTHPSDSKVKSAFKYILSGHGIIDLIAILPFFVPFFITSDLRFVRAIRLVRFLRILKINRYNNSLNLMWSVVKEKRSELAATGFVTFIVLLIASFIMFYVEGEEQPAAFPNVLATFWWAIATLTTVGYGDVYPITAMGKFISGIIAVLGIGIVALPTGLISAGFMTKIEKRREDDNDKNDDNSCPHCGKKLKE